MRRLGNSIDWERERFTMDDGLSNGKRSVCSLARGRFDLPWQTLGESDPKLHTAISGFRSGKQSEQRPLWHFRYPLANEFLKTVQMVKII